MEVRESVYDLQRPERTPSERVARVEVRRSGLAGGTSNAVSTALGIAIGKNRSDV